MTGARDSLAVAWDGRVLEVQHGTAVRAANGDVVGAVWGLVSLAEATHLVQSAARRSATGWPERPWLVVAWRPSGLTVSTSPMLPSGAFWGRDGDGRLVVASDPLAVAQSSVDTSIDASYIRDFHFGPLPARRTAFSGVNRLEPGYWATWSSQRGQPKLAAWCGPEVWEPPHLVGEEALRRYVETFDKVVADILPHVGPPVLSLSGGLDSTFVAASVARVATQEPILALHSAPIAGLVLDAGPNRDADETALVESMAQALGSHLKIEVVTNAELLRPLDAAADYQARSGVPTWTTSNLIWMSKFDQITKQQGAAAWFTGWHGNAAFSHSHKYAEDYYIRRGQIAQALALGSGSSWSRGRRIAAIARSSATVRWRRPPNATTALPGVPARRIPPDPRSGRDQWLTWLAFRGRGPAASRNPAGGGGIVSVDPFAAPSLLAVAAAIEPAEWRQGGMPRAFARRAGVGRVPDEIRLRARRGLQSADMWFVIRNDRDEYLDRIVGLSDLPGLQEIDEAALARHVEQWPWGEMPGPPRVEYTTLDRILATAQFIRHFSASRPHVSD